MEQKTPGLNLGRFLRVSQCEGRWAWGGGRGTFFSRAGLLGALLCLTSSCTGGKNIPSDVALDGAADDTHRPEPKPLPPLGRTVARPEANDWSLETHRSVVLLHQNLVLSLPQGHVWQTAPRRGTWSGFRHEATESEIWVRHVAARRTVSLDECEKEARMSWSLLRETEEDAAERVLRAPTGYGGHLSVILLSEGGGRVEAFSVGVSRCLAVVFTTGDSPGFPERLRVAANEVIETMRVPNVGERARPVQFSPY